MHILRKKKKTRHDGGFMMVEVMVAASIIAIAILSAMTVAQKSVFLSRQSLHTAQAASLLEEGAEAVRIFRDSGWTNISSLSPGSDYYPAFSGGTWTLSATPSPIGIFTRTVRISSVLRDNATKNIGSSGTEDPGTKLVTVTVSWQEGGTTVTKTLEFYLMNIFS